MDRVVEALRLAALQAGCVARRMQDDVRAGAKPGAATSEEAALTSVDLAAQDIMLLLLHWFFPDFAVDAEEDTETKSLFPSAGDHRPLIVIDPIDGTLNYSRASWDYAVMAAVLNRGKYRASLIHFPWYRVTYWAQAGKGCLRMQEDGTESSRVRSSGVPHRVLVPPDVPEKWRQRLRAIGLEVSVSRCSAMDASGPAALSGVASVSRGRPDRRRAIGYLLVREAGGAVFFGEREWAGEDPLLLDEYPGPTVAAVSSETAKSISDALTED